MRRIIIACILAYSVGIFVTATALADESEAPPTVDHEDSDRLAEALATQAKPKLVTVFECVQPGIVSDKSKNDCVILTYGNIRAMLYYQGARGENPKPVKAYRQHESGAWYQVSLPPRM